MRDPNRLRSKFLKFAGVSGVGWLLSVVTIWMLARTDLFGLFVSNFIGDLIALFLVFWFSWETIFFHGKTFLARKFILFLSARLVLIFVFSLMIDVLAKTIADLLFYASLQLDAAKVAVIAKILVTPFFLLLNFGIGFWVIEKYKNQVKRREV